MFSFPDKEEFGEIVQPDLAKYQGRLILYGAGKVAEIVDYVLRQRGVEYLCFCDTYRSGRTHCGHPVISPEELEKNYPGVPVLVTTIYHSDVVESLKQYGPREILNSVPLLVEADFSDWGKGGEQMTAEWAERLIITYLTPMLTLRNPVHSTQLAVFLTQKCNLRCLDCSTMVPFYPAPEHYGADAVMRSLENLLSYGGIKFQTIDLLGGEPFLYPALAKVLDFTLSITRTERVYVITNGTLHPGAETLSLMRHPRFFVRISDYGTLSANKDTLISLLENNSIQYELDNYTEWYENREHLTEPCDEDEAERKYAFCTNTRNKTLLDGRIFPCCKAAFLWKLGALSATEENSIDCLDSNGLHDRIRKGLQRWQEGHIDMCHRCGGEMHIVTGRKVAPAIQVKGTLSL